MVASSEPPRVRRSCHPVLSASRPTPAPRESRAISRQGTARRVRRAVIAQPPASRKWAGIIVSIGCAAMRQCAPCRPQPPGKDTVLPRLAGRGDRPVVSGAMKRIADKAEAGSPTCPGVAGRRHADGRRYPLLASAAMRRRAVRGAAPGSASQTRIPPACRPEAFPPDRASVWQMPDRGRRRDRAVTPGSGT